MKTGYETTALEEISAGIIADQLEVLSNISIINGLIDETVANDWQITAETLHEYANQNILQYTMHKTAFIGWISELFPNTKKKNIERAKRVAPYIKALIFAQFAITSSSLRGYFCILHTTFNHIKMSWNGTLRQRIGQYAQSHDVNYDSPLLLRASNQKLSQWKHFKKIHVFEMQSSEKSNVRLIKNIDGMAEHCLNWRIIQKEDELELRLKLYDPVIGTSALQYTPSKTIFMWKYSGNLYGQTETKAMHLDSLSKKGTVIQRVSHDKLLGAIIRLHCVVISK